MASMMMMTKMTIDLVYKKKRGICMDVNIIKRLNEAKDFVKNFSAVLENPEEQQAAKQVHFLDNKQEASDTMEFLKNLKDSLESLGIEFEAGSEEEQSYELSTMLFNKLSKTLVDFRNSYAGIKPTVTEEETIRPVTDETIKEAIATNKSTQKIVKDMDEISQQANASQLQEFSHVIYADGKSWYVKANTKEELVSSINQVGDQAKTPVQVFEIVLKPLPLQKKTIYTV